MIGVFKNNVNLLQIHLRNNLLTSLPSYAFSGPLRLRNLIFKNNRLNSIANDTFKGLHSLVVLDLSNNSLSSLPRYIFHSLRMVQVLYLHDNDILHLPADIFDNKNNLRVLFLKNNNLGAGRKIAHKASSVSQMPVFNISHSLQSLHFGRRDDPLNMGGSQIKSDKIQHFQCITNSSPLKLPSIRPCLCTVLN